MPTILVIEDDSALKEALVDILELEGFQVLSADDGLAGVSLAREQRPDLVVCDITMPFLDGYGVLSRLRQYPQTVAIPFIFLTARTTQADMRRGLRLGADDYLTKPFSEEELVAAVHLRLERQAKLAEKFQQRVEALHSSLVTVLPHELRTPLNGVLGGIALLKDEYSSLEPSDIDELISIVEQSGLRLQRLVENCLLYADLAHVVTAPERIQVNSAQAASPLMTTLQPVAYREAAAADREDDLRMDLQEEIVAMPQPSLAKVFEEVLNNAFKYSEKGTLVQVSTHHERDELWITVIDHGRGMRREEIAALGAFRQFQRSRYEQQGLGLGLAITHHILNLHGGKLTIESSPGEGTTVRLMIPVVSDASSF